MPKIHPQRIEIRGNPYTILTRRMRKFDGLCDHPTTPFREIWIHPQLKGVALLETITHELLHAAIPDLSEETVHETARDVARILWELNYRGETDD